MKERRAGDSNKYPAPGKSTPSCTFACLLWHGHGTVRQQPAPAPPVSPLQPGPGRPSGSCPAGGRAPPRMSGAQAPGSRGVTTAAAGAQQLHRNQAPRGTRGLRACGCPRAGDPRTGSPSPGGRRSVVWGGVGWERGAPAVCTPQGVHACNRCGCLDAASVGLAHAFLLWVAVGPAITVSWRTTLMMLVITCLDASAPARRRCRCHAGSDPPSTLHSDRCVAKASASAPAASASHQTRPGTAAARYETETPAALLGRPGGCHPRGGQHPEK